MCTETLNACTNALISQTCVSACPQLDRQYDVRLPARGTNQTHSTVQQNYMKILTRREQTIPKCSRETAVFDVILTTRSQELSVVSTLELVCRLRTHLVT